MPGETKISAVIFDFNGTLFYDTEFHNLAWTEFTDRHSKKLTEADLEKHVHGSTNKEILGYLFRRELSPEEIRKWSNEEEEIYRELCRQHPDKCILTPGSEVFLDFLKQKDISRTIATASIAENVRFFVETFDLQRWFDTGKIIYDTGEYRGKPFPDMFLAAADRLETDIRNCMIIEDSLGGVKAARNAGAARIIAYQPDPGSNKFDGINYIDQEIVDFRQINLSPA